MNKRILKWLTVLFIAPLVSILVHCSNKNDTSIHLTTLDWPPYYGSSLQGYGVVSNIVQTAFSDAKYSVKFTFVPWARALRNVEAGTADGLLGAYKTDERTKTMFYSSPIFFAEEVFYQRSDRPKISFKTMKDLESYKIGVLNGASHSQEFDSSDFLKKNLTSDIKYLIDMLLHQRVDLIIQSKLVVLDYINTHHDEDRNKISQVEPIVAKRALYITIKKSKENGLKIIEDFNESLNMLTRSGKTRSILEDYNFN